MISIKFFQRTMIFGLWATLFLLNFSKLMAETSFFAIDASTGKIIAAIGPDVQTQYSPCSTFKIVLSLAGYDSGILKNANDPVWDYDGSKVFFESHKIPQSPKSWMAFSVIWYSKILAQKIGRSQLQEFVSKLAYGNQNLSGDSIKDGYKTAHLSSSLQISPKEQVLFLKKLVNEELPISAYSMQLTKQILFDREFFLEKLFGKAGSGFDSDGKMLGWYVGWMELEKDKCVFALLITDLDSFPSKEERQKIVIDFLHSKWNAYTNRG